MAGGRELATPFGKVFSTNITSDKQTGIGQSSFEQFDRAVRRGVAADGHNLYPAMPYPSYAVVHVRSPLGEKITKVRRSPPEAIARQLLSELVREGKR